MLQLPQSHICVFLPSIFALFPQCVQIYTKTADLRITLLHNKAVPCQQKCRACSRVPDTEKRTCICRTEAKQT